MRSVVGLGILGVTLILCGALGDSTVAGEVSFDNVEREHFDAFAVRTERGPSSQAPLVVRVNVVGDAADSDLSAPFAWLRDNANILVVRDPRGVPLFLTTNDLAATSGRSTLGATVPAGMAAEMGRPDVGACVVAHEILHFVGLRHDEGRRNIMYRHCTADHLAQAEITDEQLARLASVRAIRATTPSGVVEWASRSNA